MAKRFSIKLEDKALKKQIQRALKENPKATGKAVTDCVLDLAGNSAKRAPIESGDLSNNCHGEVQGQTVFENQKTAGGALVTTPKVSGSVGYSLPYALRQHEDLTLLHDRTDGYKRADGSTVNMVAGGEAKFLEAPYKERKQTYVNRFKRIVGEVIK